MAKELTQHKEQWKQELIQEGKTAENTKDQLLLALEEQIQQRKDEFDAEMEEKRTSLEAEMLQQRHDFETEMKEQRETLEVEFAELESQRQELGSEWKNFHVFRQRAAMVNLLSRPWRQDQEAVSAAFSKWVRVTMFENGAESETSIQVAREEIQKSFEKLAFLKNSQKSFVK